MKDYINDFIDDYRDAIVVYKKAVVVNPIAYNILKGFKYEEKIQSLGYRYYNFHIDKSKPILEEREIKDMEVFAEKHHVRLPKVLTSQNVDVDITIEDIKNRISYIINSEIDRIQYNREMLMGFGKDGVIQEKRIIELRNYLAEILVYCDENVDSLLQIDETNQKKSQIK